MFSLLSPFALWLAPLLVVPLAIALWGRAQPKVRDFPSLLPVRSSLQRAMKRQRLKNWLQLILRTLVLLCLLLAAAGPVWRGMSGQSALPPPSTSGLLLHNGAYARIPLKNGTGVGGSERPVIGHHLAALREGLDSLTSLNQGRTFVEPLISGTEFSGVTGMTSGFPARGEADHAGLGGHPVVRYGAPGEAAARLFQRLEAAGGSQTGAAHVYVPVFAAPDLAALARAARPWLEARPGARLVVLDYGDAAARLKAFGRAEESFGREGTMTVRVEAATPAGFRHAPVWRPAGAPGAAGTRETRVESGRAAAAIDLAVPEALDGVRWIAGTFASTPSGSDPAHPEFAVTQHPVAYRIPPPATLCHVGSREAFVSLATLGAGGKRLMVRSLSPAEASSGISADCDLLYLADPPAASAALLAQAAAVLRTGGTVILETGRHTDVPLWNRNLLVPLEIGRLTEVLAGTPSPVFAANAGLGAAGIRADRWGQPGAVKTRFGFRAATGTATLLQVDANAEESRAVLVHRRVGEGRLLLWTTSLSDPAWSDIGLGPWAALLHQAVLEGSWAAGIEPRRTDTDSLAWWPATGRATETPPRVFDAEGNAFARVRGDAGGWTIGPFDAPGLYRIVSGDPAGNDVDAWLAVDLATPPPALRAADWAAFQEALGPVAWSRTLRLGETDAWQALYEGVNLRFALLVLAALLLFAEGVVSLRLAHASRGEASR